MDMMKFKYNGLWKLLIDNEMKKKDLIEKVKISPTTLSKMSKGEPVSLTILGKIAKELNTDIGMLVSIEREIEVYR